MEANSSAILRVCSYHRIDFDLMLIRSRPYDMQRVQESMQTAFENGVYADLGILDHLPAEVIVIILRNLDLLSYFRFRQVNRRARVLSTSLREYSLVAKHGLEGLRALLRAKIAYNFTAADLYLTLNAATCVCGAFGGFLFLPTLTRCCFACIRNSAALRVLSISCISKLTKISTKRLGKLLDSILYTVPGSYSTLDNPARRPKCLVAHDQTVAALQNLGLLSPESTTALQNAKDHENYRFMVSASFPWFDSGRGLVEHGVCCKGCQVRVEARTGTVEDRDRVFSEVGFLAHFTSCVEAQTMWAESQEGTSSFVEPEFTRRSGFFSILGLDGLLR